MTRDDDTGRSHTQHGRTYPIVRRPPEVGSAIAENCARCVHGFWRLGTVDGNRGVAVESIGCAIGQTQMAAAYPFGQLAPIAVERMEWWDDYVVAQVEPVTPCPSWVER